jgi:hypothetical protein
MSKYTAVVSGEYYASGDDKIGKKAFDNIKVSIPATQERILKKRIPVLDENGNKTGRKILKEFKETVDIDSNNCLGYIRQLWIAPLLRKQHGDYHGIRLCQVDDFYENEATEAPKDALVSTSDIRKMTRTECEAYILSKSLGISPGKFTNVEKLRNAILDELDDLDANKRNLGQHDDEDDPFAK